MGKESELISRREFLRSASLAGLGIALSLSACQTQEVQTNPLLSDIYDRLPALKGCRLRAAGWYQTANVEVPWFNFTEAQFFPQAAQETATYFETVAAGEDFCLFPPNSARPQSFKLQKNEPPPTLLIVSQRLNLNHCPPRMTCFDAHIEKQSLAILRAPSTPPGWLQEKTLRASRIAANWVLCISRLQARLKDEPPESDGAADLLFTHSLAFALASRQGNLETSTYRRAAFKADLWVTGNYPDLPNLTPPLRLRGENRLRVISVHSTKS